MVENIQNSDSYNGNDFELQMKIIENLKFVYIREELQ
jgi:hypothetical protein